MQDQHDELPNINSIDRGIDELPDIFFFLLPYIDKGIDELPVISSRYEGIDEPPAISSIMRALMNHTCYQQ